MCIYFQYMDTVRMIEELLRFTLAEASPMRSRLVALDAGRSGPIQRGVL